MQPFAPNLNWMWSKIICYSLLIKMDIEGIDMDTISFWNAITQRTEEYPELSQDIEVDVAVVGGGITGITTALNLIKQGKKVAILEAKQIGGVTTSFSTGNLYIPIQPYYQNIVAKFNRETAKAIAQSRKFAIDYIEQTINEINITCNFARRPWYVYAKEDKAAFLDKEVNTFKQIDIDIEYTKQLPLSFSFNKAAIIANQARFNPLAYVTSIASYLKSQGCLIYENTRVLSIDEKEWCTLKTQHGTVTATKTVLATHTPIGINLTQEFTAPYRSYVVAAHLQDEHYPEGNFWDLSEPHHATSTHASTRNNNPDILMVAGNHHKTGQGTNRHARFTELEAFLKKNFSIKDIAYHWSAQHYHAADGIPYIGYVSRFAKHTYMATGFFADGLIYGTLAGIIVADLIVGKNNVLEKTYSANRFTPRASATFLVKENVNLFLQYLKDYPFAEVNNFNEVKKGEGKVLGMGGEKWAVFRDDNNQLHVVSAVCTHMKCIVNWNNAERSWDCPCHGSRFTCDGDVLEGPAIKPLKQKL